jgi:hypothetical protein
MFSLSLPTYRNAKAIALTMAQAGADSLVGKTTDCELVITGSNPVRSTEGSARP